jgi:hypothetical protein
LDTPAIIVGASVAAALVLVAGLLALLKRHKDRTTVVPPNSEQEPKPIRYVDIAPDRWFRSRATSTIWVTGYRCALAQLPAKRGTILDLGSAVALVVSGALNYFDGGTLEREIRPDGGLKLKAVPGGNKAAPAGEWVVVIAPFEVDGRAADEPAVRQLISGMAGLVSVVCGRNSIYERVFDNVLKADGSLASGFSSVIENPSVFPRPDFSQPTLDRLARLGKAVGALPARDQNRVLLSLHWHESALRSEGIDAFLKSWIALEVLTMPDGTNIRPINECLSAGYGLSLDLATDTFQVGRLFGMRSRIVHAGEKLSLHYRLEQYVQAVYDDTLHEILQVPGAKTARSLLDATDVDLPTLLRG